MFKICCGLGFKKYNKKIERCDVTLALCVFYFSHCALWFNFPFCNKYFTNAKFLLSAKKSCSLRNSLIFMLLEDNDLYSGTELV